MVRPLKVAVFGASGQLGHDLLRRFEGLSSRFETVALGRPLLDAKNLPATESRLQALDFDVAINCVAATRVDDCESDEPGAMAVNADFAGLVARLAAARRARLIQVSTDYVFGGQVQRSPLDELASPAPLNVYGATKGRGEAMALEAYDQAYVLRVASLFGVAGASGKGGNFVETMIRFGRERGALNVVDDQVMSPTSTDDVAEAIVSLIDAAPAPGVYHAVNGGEASWFEFARTIISRAGVGAEVSPIPTSQFPTPAMRPPYSVLDNTKLNATRAIPMAPWQDALDRYLIAKGHRAH